MTERRRRALLVQHRNRRGERVAVSSFTATDAKNEFGAVLETAIEKGIVVITRHAAPRAVLLSMEEFDALVGTREQELDTLSREFDALLEGMQAPKVRKAMKAAFGASPARLGKAAVAAVRRRG